MGNAVQDIVTERLRQVEAEGWTLAHDDTHDKGEIARAAASYAYEAGRSDHQRDTDVGNLPPTRPWTDEWWKPTDRRRDLVKAGALIVAEIERVDRAAARDRGQADTCPVCSALLVAGEPCALDIELGTCHAACLEGSPTVDLDTGAPVDGPIPTFPYVPAEAS